MKKAWSQTWKNLLFQHFELKDPSFLQALLPEGVSLDVDSLLSVVGARVFYKLPYRFRRFADKEARVTCYQGSSAVFDTEYSYSPESFGPERGGFAHWATERYFFIQEGRIGNITHAPWRLHEAKATNHSLRVLEGYDISRRHDEVLFCPQIAVQTYKLKSL